MVVSVSSRAAPAPPVTSAVDRGLAWLAAQQRADGSWSDNVALNALPMLVYLSAGRLPTTNDLPTVRLFQRALPFVLAQQGPQGEFTAGGGMMYGHGITTLLLAELVGMTDRDAEVRQALHRAVELILRSQAVPKPDPHAGGWRYDPDATDSDLSVTGWQIIALKAASDGGISVPRAAIDRAVAYVRSCEHPQGGFGYQPGGLPNQARTGLAIVALRACGEQPSTTWLAQHPVTAGSSFLYYAAGHCAHAGAGFDPQLLLASQQPDGSWRAPADSAEHRQAGPLYTTAMAVLALTADWNYLPAYLW